MLGKLQKLLEPSNTLTSIFQLSLPIAIYAGVASGAGWGWWALAVFFWSVVYTIIGNNIALHRYYTHGQFTINKPTQWLFLWSGTMIGIGGPLSYALTHLIHHKHPDTELDPHGPIRGIKSILMYFQKTVDPTETPLFSRKLVELNKKYRWLHNYYVLVVLANATILWLIDFKLFLFLWAIPASMTCWTVGWAVWRQHIGMVANNAPTHRYEIMYDGLHLNHHLWPMAPNTAINDGEIDWTYQASRLFCPTYNWKGQPKNND